MSQPDPNTPPWRKDLVIFYDDFAEFRDHCAFLCEAIASMVAEEDRFDAPTAMGIKRVCYWVKDRAQELNRELKQIIERANARDD